MFFTYGSFIYIEIQNHTVWLSHANLTTPPDRGKDGTAERLASHRSNDAHQAEKNTRLVRQKRR